MYTFNLGLYASQPSMSVDETLMIFFEYITISSSLVAIRSVILCIENISKINKKYEDCVLQTGLVGAVVDLLRNLQNNKNKYDKYIKISPQNTTKTSSSVTEIGIIIVRILSYFTANDKRSCLVFRIHHGINCVLSFINTHKSSLSKQEYNHLIQSTVNMCSDCVRHSEDTAMQMYESNGLEMCLDFLSNYELSENMGDDNKIIGKCIDLISGICENNPKIHQTFIEIDGFNAIINYLIKLQNKTNLDSITKSNIIKLLQIISILCLDVNCANKMLSNGALSYLYPFLLNKTQHDNDIKKIGEEVFSNILRYGMKNIIEQQSTELYKFNQTHTKVHVKKNMIYIS